MGNYLKPLLGKIITVRELLEGTTGDGINSSNSATREIMGLQILTYPNKELNWKGGQAIIESIKRDPIVEIISDRNPEEVFVDIKNSVLVESIADKISVYLPEETKIFIPEIPHFYPVQERRKPRYYPDNFA